MFHKVSRSDLLIDVLIAALVMAPLSLVDLVVTYRMPETFLHEIWPAIVAALLFCMLALRRMAPVPLLLAAFALSAVHVLVMREGVYLSWFGVLLLLATVGRFAVSKVEFWLTGFVIAVSAMLVAIWSGGVLFDINAGADLSGLLVTLLVAFIPSLLLFAGAVLSGVVLRLVIRNNQEARERRKAEVSVLMQMQLRAAEEERTAIARDMHDVVAHSLAVVVAQANGAKYAADPEVKNATLGVISQTASSALVDVRGLLHQLRHSQAGDVSNGIGDIPALVDRMRGAGLDIRLQLPQAQPQISRTTELATYRIVQEALTNSMRHGAADAPVHVRVVIRNEVIVDVHNRPRTYGGPAVGSGGHGLTGMRERAAIAGGAAWIGLDHGWFRVHVRLPLQAELREESQ